jgi:hypothetical protein
LPANSILYSLVDKDQNSVRVSENSNTTMIVRNTVVLSLLLVAFDLPSSSAFTTQQVPSSQRRTVSTIPTSSSTIILQASSLSPLPKDISPFEKSSSKSRDVQGEFRKIAQKALVLAIRDGQTQLELEFPPLLGGAKSKSQFDDFDNVQELNQNRDWCLELLPTLNNLVSPIWFILPDLKEVELAKEEWAGQRYRQAASWSSIEAVADHYSQGAYEYAKPWGATFAEGMSSLLGGDKGDAGLLGDQNSLDPLVGSGSGLELEGTTTTSSSSPALHLVCQPGNGGPVEDWVNVKAIHKNAGGKIPTCIVNGALDKVRDGYYAGFIFPKLATTFEFYKQFDAVFFLKPISDKGLYGWLYRVYPEPWQVYLQTPYKKNGQILVQDQVALVSDKRPSYAECVQALLTAAPEASTAQ